MFDDDKIYELIDSLLLNGGIEIAGIDPITNELLYRFTPALKDIMPELYNEHLNMVNQEIMSLWEKGFLEVDFFQEDPTVKLTTKAANLYEVSQLSPEDRWALAEIIHSMAEEV